MLWDLDMRGLIQLRGSLLARALTSIFGQASWKNRLAMVLVVLSFLFYGLILLVPFASLTIEAKVILSAILAILGEASFWIAVLIAGREIIGRYRKLDLRRRLSSWQKDPQSGSQMPADPDLKRDEINE